MERKGYISSQWIDIFIKLETDFENDHFNFQQEISKSFRRSVFVKLTFAMFDWVFSRRGRFWQSRKLFYKYSRSGHSLGVPIHIRVFFHRKSVKLGLYEWLALRTHYLWNREKERSPSLGRIWTLDHLIIPITVLPCGTMCNHHCPKPVTETPEGFLRELLFYWALCQITTVRMIRRKNEL